MSKIKLTTIIVLLIANIVMPRISMGQKGRSTVQRDVSKKISANEFNKLVDQAIISLKTKNLSAISDKEHVNIMMCLNTVESLNSVAAKKGIWNVKYKEIEILAAKKNYVRDITKVYPDWTPNVGMGYYFKKLNMELHGLPRRYAVYDVYK